MSLTYREGMTVPDAAAPQATRYVDWQFANATGTRLVPAGPKVTVAEASEVVASVRAAAYRAQQPVAETARLHARASARSCLARASPGDSPSLPGGAR